MWEEGVHIFLVQQKIIKGNLVLMHLLRMSGKCKKSMTSEVIEGHLFIQISFITFLWTTFFLVSIYVSIQFKFVYLSKFNFQNDGNLALIIYSSVRLFVYLASYLSTFFLSTYLDIFIYLLTYNTYILYLAWSMVGIWFLLH